jgi:AcrR family transcriptional regulator
VSSKPSNILLTSSVDEVLLRAYPGSRGKLKREILAGALDCFNQTGLESTTIEMIRAHCDTSVGAIYHHFKSKEGLAAILFFSALDDQHALMGQQLEAVADGDIKSRIEAMVCSYMQWVSRQPALARFMFQARSYVSKGPQGDELARRNKAYFAPIVSWLTEGIKRGDLRSLPRETYAPLIMGPAESYCRGWLAGRAATRPQQVAAEFAQAAWRSVSVGP